MGRIEDALRKLEDERRRSKSGTGGSQQPTPARAIASLKTLSLETTRDLVLDVVALRRWGPVVVDGPERARKEYGQVKRPIVEHALGRTAAPGVARNIVLVTSALAGEGKSVTAMNLALSLSREKDISVILIDADTVKPDISRALTLDHSLGLTDLLADDHLQFGDVLHRVSDRNLYFVPAGVERLSATELVGSQRMVELMGLLSRDLPRSLVVIDSSPLLLTNETPVLVSLAGQVVLVVRANRTPRLVLSEALDKLDSAKPVGLVLNAVSTSESGYYGSYAPELVEQTSAA